MAQLVVGASLHSPVLFFSLSKGPTLPRHSSSVGIERGANKRRIVRASAAASPSQNFRSVSFPVRFFSSPPSFPWDALAIALFVSSVLAAVAFVLKLGRKSHISERKIVPYESRGGRSRSDYDAGSGERIIAAPLGGTRKEETDAVLEASSWTTEDLTISSLVDPLDSPGRGLELQGLGFRDSSKQSSSGQKVLPREIDEEKPAVASLGTENVRIGNVMKYRRQLFDEVNEGCKNVVSKAFFRDVESLGNDNITENEVVDEREDDMETNKEGTPFPYEASDIFSTNTRIDENDNVAVSRDESAVEEAVGSRIVAATTDGLSVSGSVESEVTSGNSQIIVNDDMNEVDGYVAGIKKMSENDLESTNLLQMEQKLSYEDTKSNFEVLASENHDLSVEEASEVNATISGTKYELRDFHFAEDRSSDSLTTLKDLSLQYVADSSIGSGFGCANHPMEDFTMKEQEELSAEAALQGAMPVIAVGMGTLGMLSTGGHGALEMVGFIALTSFIAYDLLWASNRERWWRDISKVTDREQFRSFLRSRNIIRNV